MRINVNPDGMVEFSVDLNSAVDPSFVANMVAAVRRGIVAPPAPEKQPFPPQTHAEPHSQQHSLSQQSDPPQHQHHYQHQHQHSHPHSNSEPQLHDSPAEPTSDPDPDPSRLDRTSDRVPSPLVCQTSRNLSVRQLAAEIESRPRTDTNTSNLSYAEYDPIREFSSSPALWLTRTNFPQVEPTNSSPRRSQGSSVYSTLVPNPHAQDDSPWRRRPQNVISKTPNTIAVPIPSAPTPPARPIRMLSLPSGARHDDVKDMSFPAKRANRDTIPLAGDQHSTPRSATPRSGSSRNGASRSSSQAPEYPHTADLTSSIRRSASASAEGKRRAKLERHSKTDDIFKSPVERHVDAPFRRSLSELTESQLFDHDKSVTPSSPYVQDNREEKEDPDDAWDHVEYELTESYRHEPIAVPFDGQLEPHAPASYSRSAWRLFSSIGHFGRRKPEALDDVHQSTLGPGSLYKSDNLQSAGRVRRYKGHLFNRNNVRNGALWLEFTSPLAVERMLAEVGKVAKGMGFQVWRRPGENKLRCIRRLTHRHEMHMVIFVGSIRIPEGVMSVVRMRRARGDRNRTETWRYAQFYRELIERLQRSGIDVSAGE